MATQYSNKPIVTNGLVYALDFGNQKSYVSGSSSARSLLFNPLTASVSGSPTFTSTGLLNLSSSSNVLTNKTFSELTINNSYTVSTLVQVKSAGVFWNQDASPSADASYLWPNATGVGHLVTDSAYLQGSDFRRGFNADLSQLTHITYRNYSGSFDVFINGVPVNTTGDVGLLRGSGLNLNGRSNGDSFWSGSIGNFYIYNRALTSDEIYSNYLLTAQRFGLRTTPKPYTVDENAYLFLSQSGITDPIITSSIDTFVRGLKANNLWGKMAVIYPFVGTGSVGVNLTGSHKINLKEPGINAFTYSGAWNGSVSGSTPSGSGTYIDTGVNPQSRFPNYVANNYHMSILSYDTPVSSSALMGTGMTEDLAVSTFTIYATTSSISASINNDIQSGIASTGPLGFITVSRTGSNALTIAKNGVTSSFTVPASGALTTGIYLGAVNNNGIAVGSSPYNISFASVGTGLTGNEAKTLSSLVRQLQVNLQRFPSTYTVSTYPNAIAAFSLRKLLTTYTGSAIEVRRSSDNATLSIGFNSYGNLDTVSLLSFVGSSTTNTGYITQWYDQSGNNNHISQSTAASQPIIVWSGSIVTAQTFQTRQASGPNGANNNILPAIYFNGRTLGINRTLYSTNQISYYTVFNLGLSENTSIDGYSVMATNTETGGSGWSWYSTGGGPSGYINMFQQAGSSRRENFPGAMPKGGTVLYSGYHTGSAYTVYVNNVSKGTDTQQQFGSGSFLTVGAGNQYQFAGSIQELVFYATGSTANNTGIQDSINTYYQVY